MKMTMFRSALRAGAVVLCGAALCTAPMMAQGGGGRGMMSPEAQQAQFDDLSKALGLTADQLAQVKTIYADTVKKMTDVRNSGEDMQTAGPKYQAIREEQRSKIRAVLTDEQKPKYEAYLAAHPGGRRGGGQGGAGTTAPPTPPPAQ